MLVSALSQQYLTYLWGNSENVYSNTLRNVRQRNIAIWQVQLNGKASYLNTYYNTNEDSRFESWYTALQLNFIEYKILFGWIAKWTNAPDCKSGGSAFEGSNPSPSINSGVLSSDDQEMKTPPGQEEMLVNLCQRTEEVITVLS